MAHFFTEPEYIHNDRIELHGEDVNHMKNVLRMKAGDECTVSDGTGMTYLCRISSFHKDYTELDILEPVRGNHELKAVLKLFQGLPKSDKMETVIQKSVELGVSEIIPVNMKRCIVHLDEKKQETKIRRYRGISESAAKQSQRDIIPEIKPLMNLKDAVIYAKETSDVILVPYENAKGMENTKMIIRSLKTGERISVFIGPEGGFEEEEIELLKDAGAEVITLGKRILRTETAGPAVLSILMFHLEQDE